ncbi:alpha/beta fold hydrolase [Acidaminobacter hydrogenoformans]|nr:alpha/beta hydrolase [Acidaminobacter hydrogenoformans]
MDFATAFPIGYRDFHKDPTYNFQLNRWHSLGLMPSEDLQGLGTKIITFADWKSEMVQLAEKATSENRLRNAAFYYRAAEFYTINGDQPDKEFYYDKFSGLFYQTIDSKLVERKFIPYTDRTELPVLRIRSKSDHKGTILLHGGFDSFLEEWYLIMEYLSTNGFDVIAFEGPGQGHMLIKQGVPLDYQWEKPVKAVLDHYGLNDATLFGLSMGGWFCLRAAAFEPRIKNVITSGHAVDYSRIPPAFARWLMMFFIKYFRAYTGRSFKKMAARGGIKGWQVNNLAHITKQDPLEAFEYSLNLNKQNLNCDHIKQNVLYLTGRDDHFIPFKMHDIQLKLFTNVKSLKDRVYEQEDYANHHCQIGNIKLMLDDIVEWLETLESHQ